ncbi:PREDICTED: protein gamma response 1 isoform X2 [Nelumbo nucifera]|uniref:Protein gamma response 1 isoform X2 n=2 Tax=Nelumbo nucifera TaxID=4432 RepID=A0A1U8Q680_NELNU|nr:PREDICTED: protein gamma response 1 isoform X2 [Nelumbo nucifera]DAD29863.1 TPA_asm: hypothetical protein HUJ06_031331 [Nelumbo nucifera]
MEGGLKTSPQLGFSIDNDEAIYISGLSTILVATIQEVKDKISQMEYIFCSQLYPKFQSRCKSLQGSFDQGRRVAENEWRDKEDCLLCQIKELSEKNQVLEQNQQLIASLQQQLMDSEKLLEEHKTESKLLMAKLSLEKNEEVNELRKKTEENDDGRELQEKTSVMVNNEQILNEYENNEKQLLAKIDNLEEKIEELQYKLSHKTEEAAEGEELLHKLLKKIESDTSVAVNRNKSLMEHEENKKELLARTQILEGKIDELQCMLRQKTEEMAEGTKLQENLRAMVESKSNEMVNLQTQLINLEKNVKELTVKLEQKTAEVSEGKKLQEKLFHLIELKTSEELNNKKSLSENEKEKELLLIKIKSVEKNIDELQNELKEKTEEIVKGKKLQDSLRDDVARYMYNASIEERKRKHWLSSYKHLKSQYNFLCRRLDLTVESTTNNRVEEETDSSKLQNKPRTSEDPEKKDPDISNLSKTDEENDSNVQEKLVDDGTVKLNQCLNSYPPSTSVSSNPPKYPISEQSKPLVGTKRPVSYWRNTRSHQEPGGPDPHDDFLDTPMEKAKENLNKAMKEKITDFSVPTSKDPDPNVSDDETQDIAVNPIPASNCQDPDDSNNEPPVIRVDPAPRRRKISIARTELKSVKYVEPARKKAERENLKGIECKQCKKFYDAVLPDDRGAYNDNNNKHNFRCEHHDGVSRHRYRYLPPMTPEGFWNIGFDSDM